MPRAPLPLHVSPEPCSEGSSQLSIRVSEIAALGIAVPPLAQQARIVSLADAAQCERHLLSMLVHNRDQQLAALANQLAAAVGLDTQ